MGCDCRQKDLMKSMPRDIPTKHPKSTGPENIGPGRADFGSVGMGEVGSLVATLCAPGGRWMDANEETVR